MSCHRNTANTHAKPAVDLVTARAHSASSVVEDGARAFGLACAFGRFPVHCCVDCSGGRNVFVRADVNGEEIFFATAEMLRQRSGVMKKGFYRRSILWILAFFGLPLALFAAMFLDVSTWQQPRWGPVAPNEDQLAPHYRTATMVLALVAAIPYLWLMLRLGERLQLTNQAIRRKRLFGNRKLLWEDIIECRDHLSYIQLVPMRKSSQIYIDYYATFNKYRQLARQITRKCREVESNIMVGRHRRRLLMCDLGTAPTLIFTAAWIFVLLYSRQRIALLGMLSGVVLAFVSAWMWVVTRRQPRRWRSGGHISFTLLVLALILPPAYFAQQVRTQGLVALAMFGLLYFLGFMVGNGTVSALLPSRKRR